MKTAVIWAGILAFNGAVGSFTWMPKVGNYVDEEYSNAKPMAAVNDLAQLVINLEVLDIRKAELIEDYYNIEDNINYLERQISDPLTPQSKRKECERQLEIERKRLYQVDQRLDRSKAHDQQIIKQLNTEFA
jgi:hypothetical protein